MSLPTLVTGFERSLSRWTREEGKESLYICLDRNTDDGYHDLNLLLLHLHLSLY